MAETLDSADALKMTTSPTQSHQFLPSPKLHSPNEGEIEEALLDDTNNNQSSSVLLLKKLECCFSGHEQDSEADTEILKTAVIQDSPSGDVAYDAALVGTDMGFPEIEAPSSCVVKFADDAIDSTNEKNREEKFADDSVYSRTVTKQEVRFADDAIDSSTVKKQEGIFADYAIDSSTVKKQEDNLADDGIDSRTVTKQEGNFADDAIVSSTVKKQEDNFSHDEIDSRTVTKQERNFSDYAIYSSTVKKQERKLADDDVDSRTVMKLERNFSDAICSGTVNKQNDKFADDAIDSRTIRKQEDKLSDDAIGSRTVKKQEKYESLKCALKIQVIDETALIESPCLGNGAFNNGKRQKTQETKEKRPKRRSSKAAKKVETSGTRSQDSGYIGNKGKKRLVYSRKEMEALRFVGLEVQKNKWIEIYCGLGPLVAKEYDELSHHQKHNATGFDFDPRTQFLRASVPPRYLGEGCLELADNRFKNVNTIDTASCFPENDVLDCSVVERECSEDDTADEDYSSIHKSAFLVTGEPDFDSGPPQDGLEYLWCVRAEQIPKVAVVKVEESKLNKAQTIYMPQIPDIMKCLITYWRSNSGRTPFLLIFQS